MHTRNMLQDNRRGYNNTRWIVIGSGRSSLRKINAAFLTTSVTIIGHFFIVKKKKISLKRPKKKKKTFAAHIYLPLTVPRFEAWTMEENIFKTEFHKHPIFSWEKQHFSLKDSFSTNHYYRLWSLEQLLEDLTVILNHY